MENRHPKLDAITFSALLAIVLGAIGSGLWQAVLGPALRRLSYWVLDAVSLSWQGYRSGVYLEIATAAPRTDEDILAIVSMLLIFVLVLLSFTVVLENKENGAAA